MKDRKKKMEIEDLALIVKKGFDELDTRAAARADASRGEEVLSAKDFAHDMAHIIEWLEDLEDRVEALENAPKIPGRD